MASSGVMSLALLGDALLYAVLPLHADAFGISLVWVGVLLSANRWVRVFAYGFLSRVSERVGLRRVCVVAAVGAALSTALYGIGEGAGVLLGARVLWGLVYALLVLVTLAYAVEVRHRAGTRVGVGQAIQRIGPILSLLAGTWAVSAFGPRTVFLGLGLLTLPAVGLALCLPADRARERSSTTAPALGRPRPVDGLFFLQGFGVDGVFALSITLLLAEERSVDAALLGGGLLLALRHGGEVLAGPLFGALGDRFGADRILALAVVLTALGFAGVATGLPVAGALVMLVFRGGLAALGPAWAVQAMGDDAPVLVPLARMQAWRDLGAATGPLVTGSALAVVSAAWLHGAVAVGLVVLLALFLHARHPG